MDYHLLDKDHIEVLAGDIKSGFWKFASEILSRDGEENVQIGKNVKSLQIRLKRKVNNLDTLSNLPASGIVNTILGSLLGPLGGLAGSAVGLVVGKNEYICIGCQLNDGRKFLARMRGSVFAEWRKFCDESQISNLKKD